MDPKGKEETDTEKKRNKFENWLMELYLLNGSDGGGKQRERLNDRRKEAFG